MTHTISEKRRAYKRAWEAAHHAKTSARKRAWRIANADKMQNARDRWASAHPESKHLREARTRAKRAGVPCTLTLANVRELLAPMRCSATGLPLAHAKGQPSALSPSIDRIAPELGYVPGNVRSVAYGFNVMRHTAHVSRDAEIARRFIAKLEG